MHWSSFYDAKGADVDPIAGRQEGTLRRLGLTRVRRLPLAGETSGFGDLFGGHA